MGGTARFGEATIQRKDVGQETPSTAIAVFLRPPLPGEVKTRLGKTIGAERACALYHAFVSDVLSTVQRIRDCRVGLFIAGKCSAPSLNPLLTAFPYTRVPQADAGLGDRMESALRWCFERAQRGIVVGTDSPSLPEAYLHAAVQALQAHDVVLGPAADGGYYLLGAARPSVPPLGKGIRYSTEHTLSDTLAAVRRAAMSSALLPPWFDVDTERDLRLLHMELSLNRDRAPATARALGLCSTTYPGTYVVRSRPGLCKP